MWESIQVSVGRQTLKGRYKVEAGRLQLEWRGGRESEWCGMLKPELVASRLLARLASRAPLAA